MFNCSTNRLMRPFTKLWSTNIPEGYSSLNTEIVDINPNIIFVILLNTNHDRKSSLKSNEGNNNGHDGRTQRIVSVIVAIE